MIPLLFPTFGLLLFALQILHQEWLRAGREFHKDFGSADRVFPKFQGEYLATPSVRPRKLIYRHNL
jgi:hypothetical protein